MLANGNQTRIKSAFCMIAVHALVGSLLIAGSLGPTSSLVERETLKLFDVTEEPPPPPPVESPVAPSPATPEGAAAPPAMKAEAAPVVAPPPRIELQAPPPIAVAPIAARGSDMASGSSDREGTGTGSGGAGSGTGAGNGGAGTGAGGVAVRTRRIGGRFTGADYPDRPARAGAEGVVVVRLTVGTNGRVTDCRLRRSSGNRDLDGVTCHIIRQRFRFKPARDAQGRPVKDTVEWEQVWSLRESGSPEAAEAACRAESANIPDSRARRSAFLKCMADLGWTRG